MCARIHGSLLFIIFFFCIHVTGLLKYIQRFIPFVSTTLRTAVTALKGNFGLYVLEFGLLILFYIYVIVWYFSLTSLLVFVEIKTVKKCENNYQYHSQEECISDENDKNGWIAIVVLYVLFLFWTQQVVQNIIHTTTSVSSHDRRYHVIVGSLKSYKNTWHRHTVTNRMIDFSPTLFSLGCGRDLVVWSRRSGTKMLLR